jgi:hypothetical protein
MADEMSELEREIDITRTRLKANIDALTSGYALDNLKDTIKAEVVVARDDALAFAKTSAADMARQGYESLKRRAAANPAAALMIGAGIGWKLWKNPPIAAALAGVGLFSLFSDRENDPLRSGAEFVRESVKDAASTTMETAVRAASDLQDRVETIAESARNSAESFVSTAAQTQVSLPGNDAQRQILLSLAGAAVAAAVGLAVHRIRSDTV